VKQGSLGMSDIHIRTEGRAGRITLTREKALNALSPAMSVAIATALDLWRDDPLVRLVMIDAAGDRAFCAGGDIAEIYASGRAGDFGPGQDFWRQEYAMNHAIACYPKPVVVFLHGFVMGGGVGLACHASHRIVGETAQIALPECGIGLVPDVGSTHLLARAPGHLGEYLGLTGARMGPGDALFCGFADCHLPEADWTALKERLARTGDVCQLHPAPPPLAPLADRKPGLGAIFASHDLPGIMAGAQADPSLAKMLSRNAPLAMAAALQLIRAARAAPGLALAFAREFRFTFRAQAQGDFLEGIRAQVIDKDRSPRWAHANAASVTEAEVQAMLAPLGAEALKLEGLE
jgi:enoyl-CoA hydratase